MTSSRYKLLKSRETFSIINPTSLQWYPGHMKKGIDAIQAQLRNIDAVIEVHDARIPLSGRHPQLKEILHVRPHMLILNKIDLADMSRKGDVLKRLHEDGVRNIEFTHGIGRRVLKRIKHNIIPQMTSNIVSQAYHKPDLTQGYNIIVVGVPNVGKSTLLNKLSETFTRRGKLASVGAFPGVTRSVMNKVKVNFDPPIHVIDTPGILNPRVPNVADGMRLALCNCLPNNLVGEENIADYLLYWLNKHDNYTYVDIYSLPGPTDNVTNLLANVALQHKLVTKNVYRNTSKPYRLDFMAAAKMVLADFHSGKFGKILLDDDKL